VCLSGQHDFVFLYCLPLILKFISDQLDLPSAFQIWLLGKAESSNSAPPATWGNITASGNAFVNAGHTFNTYNGMSEGLNCIWWAYIDHCSSPGAPRRLQISSVLCTPIVPVTGGTRGNKSSIKEEREPTKLANGSYLTRKQRFGNLFCLRNSCGSALGPERERPSSRSSWPNTY
jgi:hypothetical protein